NGDMVDVIIEQNSFTINPAMGITPDDWQTPNVVTSAGQAGPIRTASVDSNTGNDWTVTTAGNGLVQSIGTFNHDYEYENPNEGVPVDDFSWSPAGLLDDPTSATPIANGITETTTFVVTATTSAGCSSIDSVTVIVGEILLADISQTADTICAGHTVTLTANVTGGGTPYSYLWSPGGETTAEIEVNPFVDTEYYVTVTDDCGTIVSDTTEIITNPSPMTTASFDTPVCIGGTLQLNATTDMGNPLWVGPGS